MPFLTRSLLLGGALVLPIALHQACSPQVIEAVEAEGGSSGTGVTTGGSAGSGATGGTGDVEVDGGSGEAGGGGTGGIVDPCPDGGSGMDRDGDGVPDCLDHCPDDPLKTRPVTCGCGLPDPTEDAGTNCLDLQALLAHRYTFEGVGTTVLDSKGGADGVVRNTELSGAGTVVLAGGSSDQYVDLPNRIVSVQASITLEAWLQWNGGAPWQRIFDFGADTSRIEDSQSGGHSYLFLTPRTPDQDTGDPDYAGPYLRATYGRPQAGGGVTEVRANAVIPTPRILPSGRVAHVALVVGEAGSMSIYIDGLLAGSYEPPAPERAIDLSVLDDINCWLGRSQFSADPELYATYHEFRIYAGALTPEQVELSFRAGPDPVFFP